MFGNIFCENFTVSLIKIVIGHCGKGPRQEKRLGGEVIPPVSSICSGPFTPSPLMLVGPPGENTGPLCVCVERGSRVLPQDPLILKGGDDNMR